MTYVEAPLCRVCCEPLESVLDLGVQRLGGQFPADHESDPPPAPLHLMRCAACGLAQLGHTVRPALMFTAYGYRSGVTETMRRHLGALAAEAWGLSPRPPARVLDVGGNDGTLLAGVPLADEYKYVIDPSDVPPAREGCRRVRGFFPQDMPADWKDFDLIFTVACFYDADDPVGFAQAVADRLAPDGVWCVEVADAGRMAREGGWDSVCHEHLLYFDRFTLPAVCRRAGLVVRRCSTNDCNGGSLRYYLTRGAPPEGDPADLTTGPRWRAFADAVRRSIRQIKLFLRHQNLGVVHLLGASTKANTWLQAVKTDYDEIEVASDRDPRKAGRRTPGTGIPIVTEEESRRMRPDAYVIGPWHFEEEIVKREQAFLDRGGVLVFPLPRLHERRKE